MFLRHAPPISAALLLLAFFVIGCGKANRGVAPEVQIAPEAVASRPDVEAESATEVGEDADDVTPAINAHARLILAPTVITEPGDYRLGADLQVSAGDGIVVRASNVRVWLGRYHLNGPGNKTGRAIVIDGGNHVSVFDGSVERFGAGAVLLGASNCRVRGLAIRGGDETADPANGNPPQIGVMLVNSAMNRISRNHLRGINLGIFVRGGGSYENVIRRNTMVAGAHGLLGICYNPAPGGDPTGPSHDRVSSNRIDRFGTGIQASAGSTENRFAYNTIRYINSAYQDLNGSNIFRKNKARQITP